MMSSLDSDPLSLLACTALRVQFIVLPFFSPPFFTLRVAVELESKPPAPLGRSISSGTSSSSSLFETASHTLPSPSPSRCAETRIRIFVTNADGLQNQMAQQLVESHVVEISESDDESAESREHLPPSTRANPLPLKGEGTTITKKQMLELSVDSSDDGRSSATSSPLRVSTKQDAQLSIDTTIDRCLRLQHDSIVKEMLMLAQGSPEWQTHEGIRERVCSFLNRKDSEGSAPIEIDSMIMPELDHYRHLNLNQINVMLERDERRERLPQLRTLRSDSHLHDDYTFNCAICFESNHSYDAVIVTQACKHKLCSDCFSAFINNEISQGVINLRCPCLKEDFELCRAVISAQQIAVHASAALLAHHRKMKALKLSKRCNACPACDNVQAASRWTFSNTVVCDKCAFSYCAKHANAHPARESCRSFRKRTHQANKESLKTISATSVMSPCCSIAITKSDGCNHMRCVCGKEFCYLCGARDYGGTHFHPYNLCGCAGFQHENDLPANSRRTLPRLLFRAFIGWPLQLTIITVLVLLAIASVVIVEVIWLAIFLALLPFIPFFIWCGLHPGLVFFGPLVIFILLGEIYGDDD